MKLGMNLLLWTTHVEERHHAVFAEIAAHGFHGVEVPVGAGDPEHYAALAAVLRQHGLEATAVFALDAEADPLHPLPAVRERAVAALGAACARAEALGASVLCGPFHSAYKKFSAEPPTDSERERSAEVLRRAGEEHARPLGVRLAVEHLNRFECYLVNTAAQVRALVDLVDHPNVGILYDTHHAHLEERDSLEAIATCGDRLFHVHLSENDRGVPGRGQVDFAVQVNALREAGYDGWLVVESFSRLVPEFASGIHVWRNYFDDPADVVREGGPFLRALLDGDADS